MARQARLDTPGTLHHVIIRGIEKKNIVKNECDRKDFVERLRSLSTETETTIFAWALLSNHAHILLRSSDSGISHFMCRLLTGYAINYNLRHRRHGHLFQNRYKSIICEEDSYFLELVRYIHLNPLRANLVENLDELHQYFWSGHSVLVGKQKNGWQDQDYVLGWFGKSRKAALNAYCDYMQKGIDKGRRPELVGGGLVRSKGGWSQVKSLRGADSDEKFDARMLGSGEFVEQIIKEASTVVKYQFTENERKQNVEKYITDVCKQENLNTKELRSGSRRQHISRARAVIANHIIKNYGITLAEAARSLGVSTSAVSKMIKK
jgi:REP element-mobilizing transposase RayT/RNA:NAD 2'-phosphotransferase (TPT1/KptA family)